MKKVLSIAGSDSSGGAGIQADIKTMQANGVYAMTAITALTAQNTMGVADIMNVSAEFVGKQIDAVFTDIFPDAVKVGMAPTVEIIETIAQRLTKYNARNIVLDPVMVSTSGSALSNVSAVNAMKESLFPLTTLLTPNIPETEVLYGRKIESSEEMVEAAKWISSNYRMAVLCKGGHNVNNANDLLVFNNEVHWFYGEKIDNPNSHGTGCTLSSAIASNLAKGYDIKTSIERAKQYISGALKSMLNLGNGSGPLNHGFDIGGDYND